VQEFMQEQQRNVERQRREALKLGGLITTAVGIGIMVFLRALPGGPAYMVGAIPLFLGIALLGYAYVLAPRT
jgi:hypothetical protein